MRGYLLGERLIARSVSFATLDDAFGAAPRFDNVPTFFLVLPTRSRWSVLWNNGFLCSGYDSLCSNLARNHGFTSMHWLAHDDETTTEPSAVVAHRRSLGGQLVERHVYVGREGTRWLFHALGEVAPEEDVAPYTARRKRDRMDEASVQRWLERLGASPWAEDFYALDEQPCFVLERPDAPDTILRRTRAEVVTGRDR